MDLASSAPGTPPGSHLLLPATPQRCPGLGRGERGLLWATQRIDMFTARCGWHYLNLSAALPPMALLKAVPAAVVTTDAERYFHVEGAPSGLKYTDSRRILALKLPSERHAHGYAVQEVWSETARQLAREASVAPTVLDPISESDEEEEIFW